MGALVCLNTDLIFEILSRTNLETMDTCKVVSKGMKELVNDPWFVKNYNRNTRNIFGYFVQTLRYNRFISTFVSIDPTLETPSISLQCFGDDLKILASSAQGIMCCRTYQSMSYEYFACKPSTRQCVALPSPRKPGQFDEVVALMILKSKPLHYKIIRFTCDRHSPPGKDSYICEIFDSEVWIWRKSKNLIVKHCTIFGHEPSVCIGNTAYWLTSNNMVLAFDSATETHTKFQLPQMPFNEGDINYTKQYIVEYNGKLGFSCEYKWRKIMLWAWECNKWEIKKVVEIDKNEEKLIGCNLADMGLMTGYKLQVYKESGLHYFPMHIFTFRSDWEKVDLENGCMLQLNWWEDIYD